VAADDLPARASDLAGPATVGPVYHVVRLAAAGELGRLIPQGDQPAEVDGDVVGLPDVQQEGGAVQAQPAQVREAHVDEMS